MNSLCEDDSDENDIFVVRSRKPIGKLTKQRALEIKKKVLDRESLNSTLRIENDVNSSLNESDDSVNSSTVLTNEKRRKVLDDGDDISILEEKINNSSKCSDGELDKKNKTPEKSPSKLIPHYFTPKKRSANESNENANNQESSPLVTESNRSKRIKSDFELAAQVIRFETQSRKRNTGQSPSTGDASSKSCSPNELKNKVQTFVMKYNYSRSLKGIVHNEVLNQAALEQNAAKEGKKFGRLFSENEFHDIEKFFKLPDNAFEMFARMLCRKKGWHRIHTISYDDIEGKAEDIFRLLNSQNFVDLDMNKENMETQIKLLNKSEVRTLCRAFNIKVNGTGSKKSDFMDAIVRSGKSQRAVTDMWKRDDSLRREQLLKNEIIKALGPCMRLNEDFLAILNKILLLFCLPHYVPEEHQWSTQIHMMTEVHMNVVSYPSYAIKPSVIFDNRDDFIWFEKAIDLQSQCDIALLTKNTEEFTAIAKEAKVEFKKLLEDDGFRGRIKNLPRFLRRYNAGSVYAKILTTYCEKYKRSKDSEEIVEIMELLIGQDSFLINKKGSWYNLLVQAYSDLGKITEAGSRLLTALKEDSVNEVEKLQLQQRGGLLLKKKKNALKRGDLRDELDDVCTIDLTEPSKIEIKARAVDKNESGYKSVYVYKDKAGALTFSTVEETVINHYKANGFPQGVHAEGFIIQTMYFLVFFDIIYGLSPIGVFQSPYQTQPLDFSSSSFYLNRKTEIDARLNEMRSWSMGKYEELITKVYTENLGVRCVITWRDGYTPKLFCDILRCLGIGQFTSICQRLVHNYKVYRSGFPDLTVWNPFTKKCKFVEVKSPNDKLSPNQRLWLDFLKKLNVDCEVCSVKNIASRSIQS